MLTSVVLSLLLAALTGAAPTADGKGINPVQHSELSAPDTTTNASKPPNPVQHSE